MARWAIKLREFGIQYKPRLAIKGQKLEAFLAKIPQYDVNLDQGNTDCWILSMDGAPRQTGAGVGLQLKALIGERIEQGIRLDFPPSNNEAEYEAIVAGIELTISISSAKIIIQSDSQLVVEQVNGEDETWDQRMAKYVCMVKLRLEIFMAWKLKHISSCSNEKVDALATLIASLPTTETVLTYVYYQPKSSIVANKVNDIEEACPSWMTLG